MKQLLTALILFTAALLTPDVYAGRTYVPPNETLAGVQTFSMDLPNAGPYNPADIVVVRYRYSCSSLTTGCGSLTITTVVPTTLTFAGAATPPGTSSAYSSGTRTLTITRNPYNDGNSGDVLVSFYVNPSSAGQNIVVPGTSVITDPDPGSPGNASINDDVTISVTSTPPSPQYTVTKSKTLPTGTPAVGTNVTYRLSLSADQINGNVDTAPITIVDTYPAGATVVNAAGGTVDTGAHTITWTFPTTYLLDSWGGAYSPPTGSFPLRFVSNNYNGEFLDITLNYPYGTFSTSSTVTNSVCFTGTNLNECGNAQHGFNAPNPQLTPRKEAPSTAAAGTQIGHRFGFNALSGNTFVQNPIVVEAIPAGYDLARFRRSGWNFPDTNVRGLIEYSTNNQTSWTTLESNVAPTGVNNYRDFVRGTDFPTGVTHIRWTLYDDGDPALPNQIPPTFRTQEFNYNEANYVYLDIPVGTPVGTVIQNCVTASGANITNTQGCASTTIAPPAPRVLTHKTINGASLKPGDEVLTNIYFTNEGGTGPLSNPTVTDLLPAEVEFVRWESVTYPGTSPSTVASPNLEVINNYNSTGRTLLRWTWRNSPPAGSFDINGNAGVANPIDFPINQQYNINFYVRIKAGTPVGQYLNRNYVINSNTTTECLYVPEDADVNDLDNNGSTTDIACINDNEPRYNVVAAVVMGAEKWIKGHASLPNVDDPSSTPAIPDAFCPVLDGDYTRFPCIARTVPGGTFDYKIKLINYGNLALKDYVAYDVFPFMGDTGVSEILTTQTRLTQW
ncbi:MAG TPA: hypothetical protein PLO56_15045, partial [Rhodothermales bacterium]|nr:hypothetical protein [Rhodothermales bacterium]